MPRLIVGPFNRVEGDLEVTLDVAAGAVTAAYVNAPLYRGFEQILQGKAAMDALVFVPRICGICSVAQSSTAAQALADAMGLAPPDNGRIAANLVLACENLADHLTHFYLFFMPDFARAAYRGRTWYPVAEERFKALTGRATQAMLPARADFLKLMGVLAGKWPHSLALQPGGSSRPLQMAEKIRLFVVLREFRNWLETNVFGDTLENVAALDTQEALAAWMTAKRGGDFRLFLEIAHDLDLASLGRATDAFLSYGNFPLAENGGRLFPAGVWDGSLHALDEAHIAEDTSNTWLNGSGSINSVLHPAQGNTLPMPDKAGAYSWCKAPRLAGRVVETGALARQLVAGQPLLRAMVAQRGGSVLARVVARMLEIALVLPEMERWMAQLVSEAPFCFQGSLPEEATGRGLVEAARGSLGHWLEIRRGRLQNYQIIAPTTWNFSPRDAAGIPGALEQALVGAPVGEHEDTPLAVQHIVRSFDPCMVCTVH